MASDWPSWQWDELTQIGTDYEDVAEVRAYDERMAALRDRAAENRRVLEMLSVISEDLVLEVGTGTGLFARQCAAITKHVIAIDISRAMLDYAALRAMEEGIANISFVHAGFLTYRHDGPPIDAVVSSLALHHLPDQWKLVGLKRLAGITRRGARLLLSDLVFPDHTVDDPVAHFGALVSGMPPSSRKEMERHLRTEFSTFDWAMRQIVSRAGFRLEWSTIEGVLTHYLCTRL
ncbi:MAG: methyltransferase domain-containing protein [Gaiellales bacterium]|nr:methyltransferase domain-containing protein [Gaiellales bacterium]